MFTIPMPTFGWRSNIVMSTSSTVSPTRKPTELPSSPPTEPPTMTDAPSRQPSNIPTRSPTRSPTRAPTRSPTVPPTISPTRAPTNHKAFDNQVFLDLVDRVSTLEQDTYSKQETDETFATKDDVVNLESRLTTLIDEKYSTQDA